VPSSLSLQRELQSERFYNFHSSVKVAPRERRTAAIDLLSRSRGGFSTKILGQKIEGLVASTYILPNSFTLAWSRAGGAVPQGAVLALYITPKAIGRLEKYVRQPP
jgi:hypothetical protein